MEDGDFWRLEGASDLGLQRELMRLLASGYRTEARIVAHIAEVDRRRLYLKEGFSSLYKYCKVRLGLSESEAFYRMTAAAIARKYPIAFGLLEQRKIHLSGLCKLRDFLTRANHLDLLGEACGKTKQQVEELLAVRFPGRKVRDSMRRLPRGRIAAAVAPPASPHVTQARFGAHAELSGSSPLVMEPAGRPAQGTSAGSDRSECSATSTSQIEVFDPITGEVKRLATSEGSDRTVEGRRVDSEEPSPSRAGMSEEPELRQPRYRVQFDASSELKAKIELARALSSHANPSGDLEVLFERAIDLYVEQLQKKRFGKTDTPRRASKPAAEKAHESESGPAPASADDSVSVAQGAAEGSKRKRKHISHETRRNVVAKDGLRCAFVSPTGHRCDEQAFLQIHHEDPWARTRNDEPSNLRIFCAGHNRLRAEQDFGASYVARCIEESRNSRDDDCAIDRVPNGSRGSLRR